MLESTFVFIKPDAVVKNLTGDVLSRLTIKGIKIIGSKVVRVSTDLAEAHYDEHKDKPFFIRLVDHICGKYHDDNRIIAFVLQGEDVISRVRDVVGATMPEDAHPETIRGAYGRISKEGVIENVIHASANAEDAEREIKLWFRPCEIVEEIYPTYMDGDVLKWK